VPTHQSQTHHCCLTRQHHQQQGQEQQQQQDLEHPQLHPQRQFLLLPQLLQLLRQPQLMFWRPLSLLLLLLCPAVRPVAVWVADPQTPSQLSRQHQHRLLLLLLLVVVAAVMGCLLHHPPEGCETWDSAAVAVAAAVAAGGQQLAAASLDAV
jgi:hypothetical protein